MAEARSRPWVSDADAEAIARRPPLQPQVPWDEQRPTGRTQAKSEFGVVESEEEIRLESTYVTDSCYGVDGSLAAADVVDRDTPVQLDVRNPEEISMLCSVSGSRNSDACATNTVSAGVVERGQ